MPARRRARQQDGHWIRIHLKEIWVTENNPKYANCIIKQLKVFKKSHNLDDSYDPYKAAYGSMPTHAASNQAIQQMYINGHFCYAYKFGIITNGLGT